jgi:hypothetical protein
MLIAAFVLIMTSAVFAIMLPPRLRCASLGYPEGTSCPEGRRIEFEDHGTFVSVGVDRRYAERLGILAIGTAGGAGILLLTDRRRGSASIRGSGGAGL